MTLHASLSGVCPFPAAPQFTAPAGACDCHCHVFGPFDRFPLAADRSYLPPEASARTHVAMLDRLGLTHGVLVQASAHGQDNSAMLDALGHASHRLRGVAVVPASTPRAALRSLHDKGVRGLRLSRLRRPDGTELYRNTVDIAALDDLLPGMRECGLHAQLWTNLDQLPALADTIRTAGIPFVIDHLGRSRPELGVADPHFQLMCQLVEEGKLWVKLTPYRASLQPHDFSDVRPLHAHLMRLNPDRLLWGSDWPHINMGQQLPDAGHLLDLLARWTPDAVILRKILVENPRALYGFSPPNAPARHARSAP